MFNLEKGCRLGGVVKLFGVCEPWQKREVDILSMGSIYDLEIPLITTVYLNNATETRLYTAKKLANFCKDSPSVSKNGLSFGVHIHVLYYICTVHTVLYIDISIYLYIFSLL